MVTTTVSVFESNTAPDPSVSVAVTSKVCCFDFGLSTTGAGYVGVAVLGLVNSTPGLFLKYKLDSLKFEG